MPGVGPQVALVHGAQVGHRRRPVEQREHGELRQVVPVPVHHRRLLLAVGQAVYAGSLRREECELTQRPLRQGSSSTRRNNPALRLLWYNLQLKSPSIGTVWLAGVDLMDRRDLGSTIFLYYSHLIRLI